MGQKFGSPSSKKNGPKNINIGAILGKLCLKCPLHLMIIIIIIIITTTTFIVLSS